MEVPNKEDLLLLVFSNLLTLQWFNSNAKSIDFPIAFENACLAAYRTKISSWDGSNNTANDYTVANNISTVKTISQTTVTTQKTGNSYFLAIGY